MTGDRARPELGGSAPLVFNRLAWSGGGFAVNAVLTLATLAVLARLLTPTEIGLVAVAWIIVDLVARVCQASVGHILMQRRTLRGGDADVVFTLGLVLGVVCAATLWLLAPGIAALSDSADLAPLLRVLAVAPVVASLGVVPAHLLRRELRLPELLGANVGAYAVGYVCVATALALHGWGAWAPIAGELVRTAIHSGAVVKLHGGRFPLRLTLRGSAPLVSQGAGYLLTQVSGFVLQSAPALVAWRTLGTAALGYFSRAERLAFLLHQALYATLFDVAFVATAQRQHRRAHLRSFYLSATEVLALASLPPSLLLAVAAPETVLVVLGSQWQTSVPILQILALAVPLQAWSTLNSATMRGLGSVYGETGRQIVCAGLLVAGAWVGSRHGLLGVALGVVAGHLIASLMLVRAAWMLRLSGRELCRSLAPAAWTASCAIPLPWLLLGWLRHTESSPYLALGTALAAAVATSLGALRFAPRWAQPGSLQVLAAVVQRQGLGRIGVVVDAGLRMLTIRHVPVAPPAPRP